jgi:hypothetical protein
LEREMYIMEKTMMIGTVELEVATLTGLKVSEFKNKFNEFNIIDAKLVVTLPDGTEATLAVGELLSMQFKAFDPETDVEILEAEHLSF